MPARNAAPNQNSNVYTYSEVIRRLGISPSTLTGLVDKGIIQKVVPPGKKNGYYTKRSVDDYYSQQSLFLDTYIARQQDKLIVRKATEADQESIFEFEKSIYPDPAPLKERINWYHKNSHIDYVALIEEEVIGHLSLLPLEEGKIIDYLTHKDIDWFNANDIQTYEPGKQYTLYIMSAAVKQFEDKHLSKLYAGHLLQEGERNLFALAEEGKLIRRIYARSRTQTGIFLANRMQFEVLPDLSRGSRRTFVLDLGRSTSKWAEKYREHVRSLDLPKKTTQGII